MNPFIDISRTIVLDSWRVLNTLGIVAGSLVALIVLRREVGWARALLLVGVLGTGSIFGAHLAHCILQGQACLGQPSGILAFWREGHSSVGAPVFCAMVLYVLCRFVPGIPFWSTADAFALGTPLGLFFARIGCHMKGCCWGIPIAEGHPFHGAFVKLADNLFVALHPVQLYSAAAALTLFCILLVMRNRLKTPGALTALALLLYCVARFVLEFYRGDTQGRTLFGLFTLHQEICILGFLGAAVFLFFRGRGTRARPHSGQQAF
jgi:phosphatidylglycerol:prolipoprotein diacylglycerol transferase